MDKRPPLFFVEELENGRATTLFFGQDGVEKFFLMLRKLGRLW